MSKQAIRMWKFFLLGHAVRTVAGRTVFNSSTPTTLSTSSSQQIASSSASLASLSSSPGTSINPASSALTTSAAGQCTGCILQANDPETIYFNQYDPDNQWRSVVVTETVLTKYITYFEGSTIDTVVTQKSTVNQTKTVVGASGQQITHTTPTFTFTPTPGVVLTGTAGSTYVIYSGIFGGINTQSVDTDSTPTTTDCISAASTLYHWQPTVTSDWSHFIQTYTTPPVVPTSYGPSLLPSSLLGYLEQQPTLFANFSGSNPATCTTINLRAIHTLIPDPFRTVPAINSEVGIITTATFLSTTYESTSTHESRDGCLRCQNTGTVTPITPITPTDLPIHPVTPNSGQQSVQSVTIGTRVFPITPVDPPPQQSNAPSGQGQSPPVVVVGSQTLTPGQTTTIDGVTVVVPTDVGGSSIVIGGNTVAISPPGPTGPPVITVEGQTITADTQGQFVIGSQTLTPGGPAITADGNTYSLAPSGAVAVVNGVTTTLANAPAITPAPVLTVNGQTVSATVDKGTTQFVLGPGQTLAPGVALTISGTTYSMPASASGSVVVINGVTSTLSGPVITAAPALTIDGKVYSATVQGGSTQYVLGPGTTLIPGQAVTISGTTYSLDSKATALVVNGQTSTIPTVPASNSASATPSSSFVSSTTINTGDKIASGIGQTKKSTAGAARSTNGLGFDKWVEGLVVGAAGWLLLWL